MEGLKEDIIDAWSNPDFLGAYREIKKRAEEDITIKAFVEYSETDKTLEELAVDFDCDCDSLNDWIEDLIDEIEHEVHLKNHPDDLGNLRLDTATEYALMRGGINTVSDLQDYIAAGKPIKDIRGLGAVRVKAVEEALENLRKNRYLNADMTIRLDLQHKINKIHAVDDWYRLMDNPMFKRVFSGKNYKIVNDLLNEKSIDVVSEKHNAPFWEISSAITTALYWLESCAVNKHNSDCILNLKLKSGTLINLWYHDVRSINLLKDYIAQGRDVKRNCHLSKKEMEALEEALSL